MASNLINIANPRVVEQAVLDQFPNATEWWIDSEFESKVKEAYPTSIIVAAITIDERGKEQRNALFFCECGYFGTMPDEIAEHVKAASCEAMDTCECDWCGGQVQERFTFGGVCLYCLSLD